jgi:hypothetical protein
VGDCEPRHRNAGMFITDKVNDMPARAIQHVPLDRETRTNLPTPEAAYHLNRAQQTLRLWAMREDGPIRPLRINGRLAWPVARIKELVGVA